MPDIIREMDQIMRELMTKSVMHLSGKVKDKLSVPAPRRIARDARGDKRYVALTPALPGAPPRKLSGMLRRGVYYRVERLGTLEYQGVVGASVIYARRHEYGNHPFLASTYAEERAKIIRILSGE